LKDAERKRDEGGRAIKAQHEALLTGELEGRARKVFAQVWGKEGEKLLGAEASDLMTALLEARDEVRRSRALLGPYWNRKRIVVATLGALTVPLFALVLDLVGAPPLVSALGGLAAVIPAVTTALRAATQWSRKQLDTLQEAEAAVRAELTRRAKELDEEVENARSELEEAETKLADAKLVGHENRARTGELEQRLQELTPGRVLGEFLNERSRSTDYRRHLGLMSIVRDDLRNLEDLVTANNDSIAGGGNDDGRPNRIILYIDDLDRCPSRKVVEVLEAVHLLLAFELFVVVVAVDSRWLSFALTDQLHALVPDSADSEHPTPHDYLEKIFQLPFWVQPMVDDGRRSLVRGLLEGNVRPADGQDATVTPSDRLALRVGSLEAELLDTMLSRRGADPRLEANQLSLTPDDLTFVESLAPLLGETPRSVKRFVNAFQLLLAMPPSLAEDHRDPPDRAIVAFLAAVHDGLPRLAQRLYLAVEAAQPGSLQSFLDSFDDVPRDVPRAERTLLAGWLATRDEWQTLELSRLSTRLDFIRRLSFDQRGPEQPGEAMGPVTDPTHRPTT
jgi:hypothetical protein